MTATSERVKFGVAGGYGATGKAVISALLRSGERQILLGGRDHEKLKAAAARLGLAVRMDRAPNSV